MVLGQPDWQLLIKIEKNLALTVLEERDSPAQHADPSWRLLLSPRQGGSAPALWQGNEKGSSSPGRRWRCEGRALPSSLGRLHSRGSVVRVRWHGTEWASRPCAASALGAASRPFPLTLPLSARCGAREALGWGGRCGNEPGAGTRLSDRTGHPWFSGRSPAVDRAPWPRLEHSLPLCPPVPPGDSSVVAPPGQNEVRRQSRSGRVPVDFEVLLSFSSSFVYTLVEASSDWL